MIRETLDPSATNAFTFYYQNFIYLSERTTTGGSPGYQSGMNDTPPYWVKLVRSGSTFTGYGSADGINWTQVGTSQTISMASSVYIGLGVTSRTTSALTTATFDSVSVTQSSAPAPVITSLSATTGSIGSQVTISGTGFGATQSGSFVTLNGSQVTINSWSSTAISVTIPTGATSGDFLVSVAPAMNDSNAVYFTVTSQPLPASWLDADVGAVGLGGSATYTSGTFTISGAGLGTFSTPDGFHFAYQPLSGDGTIVARVVSVTGGYAPQAGIMIRETLDPSATNAFTFYYQGSITLSERTTTGGSSGYQGGPSVSLPYWIMLVRSGTSFSGYASYNGLTWTQVGATQTISMAQSVYIGLAVTSRSTSSLTTATFDNVSFSPVSSPAPAISTISATTGAIGSQVLITGSGFGPTQNGSLVLLNDVPVTINSWDATSILITIPTGATSGYMSVSVAPSMNNSNPVYFTVTSQPLATSWLDGDVGAVGLAGSATYANGTFTIAGAGLGMFSTPDGFHFVYQPLSGDGTIIARVLSVTGGYAPQAGVMIRETLDPSAKNAFTFYYQNGITFSERTTNGGTPGYQSGPGVSPPYWVMLIRSGTSFSGYASYNGLTWSQVGTTQTISMAQTVYVGLAVTSRSTSSLTTATFDNVSFSPASAPAPVITSVSATTGTVGSQVQINGSGFGAPQGASLVTLNKSAVTINSWTNTTIVMTVPSGATSGYLVVSAAPSMNDSNPVYFTVTSQPLPAPWLDQDVGPVGVAGSATYTSGTFTVKASGTQIYGTSDQMHFVYQPLSGDGTIVARVVSATGSTYPQAGVMIRETLDPASTNAFSQCWSGSVLFWDRPTTGGSTNTQSGAAVSPPYWVKVIRTSGVFYGYSSADGVTWTQIGTGQSITMAQNVYVGLAVSSYSNSTLATATFDNVSVTVGSTPVVTGVSPDLGGVSSSVTVTGSSFGATQGTSTVSFNNTAATSVSSWTNSQIVALVPTAAPPGTGPVVVTVGSSSSPATIDFTVINPTISSLAPPGAQLGAWTTLTGLGFGASQGTSVVKFNGVTATVSSWSDTSITAQVPSTATNGPVTVTVDGVTSAGVTFTVLEALSITSISTSGGPVGTTVIVTGTGFGASQSNSTLSFYGATATPTSWSDTQITATVPLLCSSGPVSVGVAEAVVYGPWFTLTSTANLTDSLGNPTTYVSAVIGGSWVPVSVQGSGCSSCTIRGTISDTYNPIGDLLTQKDELGRATTYTYDNYGNVTSVSVPIGPDTFATTSYTYNNFGEVLTTTDPLGIVTTNSYDAHGNLLAVTSPKPNPSTASSVTQFAYNSLGELTQITDPLGNPTTLTYYSTGLINTIKDAQNNVTTYVYDTHGNRTSVTDALNHQTTFAYDSMNRLTTITYPDTTTTKFAYDYRGRRTSVTDQNGKVTTYAYDDADRLTSVTDAATPGNVTTYGYDTEDNLTSIQDANGHTTSFAYDAFGRVTKTTFPAGTSEFYYYDAVGNLIQKTDRKNQSITYTYDQLNRLLQKAYPDSTAVNYTYDNDSRLTQVTDPSGTYQFTFDNMGRLTQAATQYTFLTGRNFTTSYTYDAASNRTGFTDPENGSTTYAYDTLNRLHTLTPPTAISSGNFGFSYDALSRRTQMTRPNSIATNYTYDNLSRLLSVLHQSGSTTLDGASYTVDNAGNRTAKTDQRAAVTSNYTYDAIYELTQVTQATTTTESYSFDPVGNRLSSLGVSPYANNSSNELTSTPSTTYTYDNDGNLMTKVNSAGTTQYFWDYENRMTSVTLPGSGGTVSFKYDPFGRRIYKSSSSATSVYAYDGDNLIEETNSSGTAVARYSQGLNIDEPLAMLRSATTSFYQADGLGSITSLSSGAGALAQTYTFDSFGNQTASSGSLTNPFQYTARESDPETGLYYYRARYYDPNVGRFLSEDPQGFPGGDFDLYRYVWGRPLSYRDPIGRWGFGGIVSAGAGWGLSPSMGAGSGSGQVGVFWGGADGVNLGTAVSYGGFVPCPCGGDLSGVPTGGAKSWGGGAWAGVGGGGFFTNADNTNDLSGPFDNFEINTPVGSVAVQWGRNDKGRFIFQVAATAGPSEGLGVAKYKTKTCPIHLLPDPEPNWKVAVEPLPL